MLRLVFCASPLVLWMCGRTGGWENGQADRHMEHHCGTQGFQGLASRPTKTWVILQQSEISCSRRMWLKVLLISRQMEVDTDVSNSCPATRIGKKYDLPRSPTASIKTQKKGCLGAHGSQCSEPLQITHQSQSPNSCYPLVNTH